MIDVRDVAEAAARVLETEPREHSGRIYTLTGPQALSFAEIARRLTRILGRPVEYVPVADEAKRSALLDHGLPPWIAGMIVEYLHAYATGWGDFVTDDFADIAGRPARGIDQFLSDHAPAFSP